jgi:hypothetical protein
MVEAFRSGQISAGDIIDRASQRAMLKEKADVMALQEQMAPGAQEARAQTLKVAGMRAKQAEDDLALESLHKKVQIEQDVIAKRAGPTVAAAYALAGKPIPTVKSTDPALQGILELDLPRVEKELPWISQWATEQKRRGEESKNWELKELLVGTKETGFQPVIRAYNRTTGAVQDTMPTFQAEPFDAWFGKQQPGTATVVPAAPAAQPTVAPRPYIPVGADEDVNASRAAMINKLGGTPAAMAEVANMSDGQIKYALQQPAPATAAIVQPIGQPTAPTPGQYPAGFVPGLGLVTGPSKPTESHQQALNTLATNYKTNTTVTGLGQANEAFQAVQDVMTKIQPDGTYTKDPGFLPKQGDYKLMVAYAKILDPNSVVREGEITLLQGTTSKWGRIENIKTGQDFRDYVTAVTGQQMFTAQERSSFRNLLTGSYENRVKAVQPIHDANVAAARQLGADETQIKALFPFWPSATGGTAEAGTQIPAGFKPIPGKPGQYYNAAGRRITVKP